LIFAENKPYLTGSLNKKQERKRQAKSSSGFPAGHHQSLQIPVLDMTVFFMPLEFNRVFTTLITMEEI